MVLSRPQLTDLGNYNFGVAGASNGWGKYTLGISGDWDQWIGGKIPDCTWPFCIPKDNPVDVDMWNQG